MNRRGDPAESGRSIASPAASRADSIAASEVLGLPVSRETEWQTVERIVGWAIEGRRAKVTYANPYVLTLARRDPSFLRTCSSFDLIYPDGMGTVWAARLLGRPVAERVTASDFHPRLFRRCAEEGIGVFLLGGAEGVAVRAAEALRERHCRLRILGTSHGYLSREAETTLLAELRRLRPRLLVVAMGSPAQEQWIERHASVLQPLVAWAVGGLFDFVSGRARRSPSWMTATGTEWIFRLAREPARLGRRYTLENVYFGAYILREMLLGTARAGGGGADPEPGP